MHIQKFSSVIGLYDCVRASSFSVLQVRQLFRSSALFKLFIQNLPLLKDVCCEFVKATLEAYGIFQSS